MQRRLRNTESFTAGVAAMVVATAVLGLVHLIQASFPFPPLGLAQRLLRLVPGPLAVFFIDLLGHWALRLFAVGFTAGSILAGGAAAVLVGRVPPAGGPGAQVAEGGGPRRISRGRAAWLAGGLLGVVALGGYRAQPGAPSLLVYGTVVAVAAVAYTSVLQGALGRLERDPVPAPATGFGRTRRELLRAAVGAAGLLATGFAVRWLTGGIGDVGGQPLARPAGAGSLRPAPGPAPGDDPAFLAIGGLTPEVTSNRLHYTVDESIIDPGVDQDSWKLRVEGMVGRPVTLSYDQLLAMPAIEQYVTLQCISNLVGGDLVGTAKWTGVPLRRVLERAGGVPDGAVRVVFHAVGGYSDSLPLAKALEPTTMVAYGMNDRSLPRAHGFPARIIVPGIYGMKNVKWLERIEVVDYDYRGYWQRSDGWDNIAEIKTASRIDVPDELTSVKGSGVVAGMAWAGDRGIRRVEVSLDGGVTWAPAILRRELARAAWRQWRLPLQPGRSGRLKIKVRAVDGRGITQTSTPAPPHPSGASGYHEVDVVAD
ncbi:MAG TPA: molybdopterin-dependent oxidoreductase [Actinomycetes bacterium]|jgi:DMSO/TMAO reductase YedYZ molybdopterin-dependent catalytic subunit|nr:molybdopterin-dependent oxidoreductase [Actinomycetes bacterium]